ncbi:hypothetical protein HDU93_000860, partial [Gonapodya sp. JEL0774]
MTPYDTYVTMSRAITFANSNGRLLTNSDIVRSFEGAGKTIITQVNSWLAVARYYHVIPNFNSILRTDSLNNRPHFRLPIGVIYAEGTVKVQIVDRNPDLAETFIRQLAELPKAATQKEVKELAKLWGKVYLPWINGVNDLNSSQGWMDEKKEQATELIIAGTFPKHTTRAEVIVQLARLLELTPKVPQVVKERKKEDNNPKGASKLSKEETEATPKQKKQRESRKLINPIALPTTHLVEPDKLEEALTAFTTEQGANHLVFIIDFPNPEDADKLRLVLKQGGVLIERIDMSEFAAMKSDYLTAGAPTSATVHFAFQSAPTSKGNLPDDSTLFDATNNVTHYAVTSTSPAPLNWSQGSSWRRSWANSNLFGPCTVPDLDVVKYVIPSQSKKSEKKLPYFTRQTPSALWMELITLVSNPGDGVVLPSVGTGSAATACAILGRTCNAWVFDIEFRGNLEKHFLAIDSLLREDAGKTLERLIQDKDFLRYTLSTRCTPIASPPVKSSNLSAKKIADVPSSPTAPSTLIDVPPAQQSQPGSGHGRRVQ